MLVELLARVRAALRPAVIAVAAAATALIRKASGADD